MLIWLIAASATAYISSGAARAVELEGTVQAVNKEGRSLSLLRKTSGGDKAVVLAVDSKAGDLSGLKSGDAIKASYDPETVSRRAGSQAIAEKAD